MKITKKETRVSVRITPYQETQLDLISEKLSIKRSTLVRYAIDKLIGSYNDLQLEQI
ncbi:MAG: ribbon-helix-helix domain-containing protein [Segatella copri]|uniref:ribbon-helix-helix domain-containing protein n=1 Tax=Segatella copri TaxID=165179 RepID=UPI0018855D7E